MGFQSLGISEAWTRNFQPDALDCGKKAGGKDEAVPERHSQGEGGGFPEIEDTNPQCGEAHAR